MGIIDLEIGETRLFISESDDVYDSNSGRALTGSWVWESALVLSNWMCTCTHVDLKGKSVLEIGAGAGLPGLTAARLGAARVVLTDIAVLLTGLVKNVEANGLEDRVEVKELEWGSDESAIQLGEFDVVLMSDVFYDLEEMDGLGRTLKMVCGEKTEIWAASELRLWTGACLNELTNHGFHVVEMPSQPSESEQDDSNLFAIFRIALCNPGTTNSETIPE